MAWKRVVGSASESRARPDPGLLSKGSHSLQLRIHGRGWHGLWQVPDLVSRYLADAPASREALEQARNFQQNEHVF